MHLVDGNCRFLTVPEDYGGFGGEFHQTLQSVCGPALGAGLQHLAYSDQRQDHGRGFKIEFMHIFHHGV